MAISWVNAMAPFRSFPRLFVAASGGEPGRGVLTGGSLTVRCALGRSGIAWAKREGDGATPAGAFRLVNLLYRADRLRLPPGRLDANPILADDGWCDDPASPSYNRPVKLPFAASHERLWRDDHLYDLVVVLDYNLAHPRPGAGSAIFLHLAAPGFTPTAGCVAVSGIAMRRLLARVGPETELIVG